MAICGVVASESLLTYGTVRSGGIPRSALHLTIPEQAPTPHDSNTLLAAAMPGPVVVVGGGISGLPAAYALRPAGVDGRLLDSRKQGGGAARSPRPRRPPASHRGGRDPPAAAREPLGVRDHPAVERPGQMAPAP